MFPIQRELNPPSDVPLRGEQGSFFFFLFIPFGLFWAEPSFFAPCPTWESFFQLRKLQKLH